MLDVTTPGRAVAIVLLLAREFLTGGRRSHIRSVSGRPLADPRSTSCPRFFSGRSSLSSPAGTIAFVEHQVHHTQHALEAFR